jgi:hypothetical protein
MASVSVAAIERKPSKLASLTSIHWPDTCASGWNRLSVIDTTGATRHSTCVSATVSTRRA